MHGAAVAGLSFACLVYVLFGGLLFYYLERGGQNESRKRALTELRRFVGNSSCVRWDDVITLLQSVVPVYDEDFVLSAADGKQATSWNYGDAVLLSTALVSTVGFGTYYPKTTAGRAVCVIYAIFGITLLVISVHAFGVKLLAAFRKFAGWLAPRAECESGGRKKWSIRLWMLVGVCCGVLVFLVLPASIVSAIERLTFAQALYAVFMTLSTIGLRDGIPALSDTNSAKFWIYFLLFCCWLYFGLIFVLILLLGITKATGHTSGRRHGEDLPPNTTTESQYGTLCLADCSKELFETSSTTSLRSSASSI